MAKIECKFCQWGIKGYVPEKRYEVVSPWKKTPKGGRTATFKCRACKGKVTLIQGKPEFIE